MKIKILGAHNSESRTTKHTCLLIDDVLALDAGGLTSSLSFRSQLKLKAILLTHHHYDHVRDIPAIAMNFYLRNKTIHVYSIKSVRQAITSYLLNNDLYPNFLEKPEGNPALEFSMLENLKPMQIETYSILPVAAKHAVPAAGYQVSCSDGTTIFYSGDTGVEIMESWEHISPQLIIIEVTAPNRFEEFAGKTGHLTPELLKQALIHFRKVKGYVPPVVAVHLNPDLQGEIIPELEIVSRALNTRITPASEGMHVEL